MAREQEGQEARNKAKREMFDELMKLHAKAAELTLEQCREVIEKAKK